MLFFSDIIFSDKKKWKCSLKEHSLTIYSHFQKVPRGVTLCIVSLRNDKTKLMQSIPKSKIALCKT